MASGENLTSVIKAAIWHELGDKLNTSMPAIVNKYDPSGPTVEAAPAIDKVFSDGDVLRYEPIVSVPVIFPRTNRFHFTYPLEKGDTVLLLFSQRSMETWLKGDGTKKTPLDVRKFSLTDAIAIPGFFAFKQGDQIVNPNVVELSIDGTKFVVDGDGKFNFTTSNTPLTPLAGVVTGECICAFTGLPHPDKSSKVLAEK